MKRLRRSIRSAACAAVALSACFSHVPAFGEDPPELVEARKEFEEEFFRKIEPIQDKYRGALQNYQRSFTRNEEIAAAVEASEELKRLERWETLPLKKGQRSLDNPRLNSLLQSYERAALEVMEPIVEDYLARLELIKKGFTNSAKLESSLRVKEEIEGIRSGRTLPAAIAGDRYLATLTRSEFAEWLLEQSFEFTGIIAGRSEVRFDEDKCYKGRGQEVYEYEVQGDRSVDIIASNGRVPFQLHFSQNLRSGGFKSDVGFYPLRINGEPPADFDALKDAVEGD